MADERDRVRQGRGERAEIARAEELEDGGAAARGTPTEQYTVAPTAGVVREDVTRRAAPREELTMGQRTMRQDQPRRDERGVDIPETYALDRDRVRWGPVWAGLLAALTALLALGVLGLAVGLTSVDAGQAVAQGGAPRGLGLGSALWAGISALLAFLLGGWVAGRTASVFHKGWGALNGMLVFLLAVPLLLWLAGQGLGAALGSLGSLAQSLNLDPNAVRNAAGQAGQAAGQVTPEQAAEAARTARNTAWSTLLGLGLGIGAATLGGLLGTRGELDVDRAQVARAQETIVR